MARRGARTIHGGLRLCRTGGAGKGKDPNSSAKIAKYLFGVRFLIGNIAIVSLILWVLS